jgi:hypothetical protein
MVCGLISGNYRSHRGGCHRPAVQRGVALEVASTSEPLRQATAEVFDIWIAGATEYFAAAGIPHPRARELAFSMLSLLEGAFIFCRAMRTIEPLHIAGASAVAAVQAALGATASPQ